MIRDLRIRHKLLLLLLALVIPPLVLISCYAIWEAQNLGGDLADSAEAGMTRIAQRELTLAADLVDTEMLEARQSQELMLGLMAKEAAGLPAQSAEGTAVPSGAKSGLFHSPSDAEPEAAARDEARLAGLLPELRDLFSQGREEAAWGSVCLSGGTCLTYPPRPDFPAHYDARAQEWYREAAESPVPVWKLHVSPSGGRIVMTLAESVRGRGGRPAGVAAITALLRIVRENDSLSSGNGRSFRTMIARLGRRPDGGQGLFVIGDQVEESGFLFWERPSSRHWLDFDGASSWNRISAALDKGESALASTSYKGVPAFAVCKPLLGSDAVLVIISPREVIEAGGERAEDAIMSRTWRMTLVTGGLTLATMIAVVFLGLWGSGALTQRLAGLAAAARRLASGDLSAFVPVTSRDEIGELAQTFNEMGPQLDERLRLKQDVRLAREVQETLLPQSPPSLPGLDMAGAVSFCDATGGDYFDFLPYPGGGPCDVVLADVSGHGVSAALLTAVLRGLLRGRGGPEVSPAALLTRVNRLFSEDTSVSGSFVVMLHVRVEPGGPGRPARLAWCRAGLDPALLYDPAADAFSETLGEGVPLGVLPDHVYAEGEGASLLPGQVLVMATDGVWEARDTAGEMFGKQRLREVVRAHAGESAQDLVAAVHAAVRDFLGEAPQEDDVSVVAVKALPL
ncbi:serine phosphatase [Desulfovibrio sp. X2]|uniref:SpoIIE family protein phosphatase n=1 Tax=Desulfovibrio sp. X2 TaxID=941449 RepID=UPI000358AE95|nr:SpoIIE family protein phosphatase [Desulfovibrio sp. X2]EPR43085.1 serine phosphatase [Desulfovibrio sp. X2]